MENIKSDEQSAARDALVTIVNIWRESNWSGELEIDAFNLLMKFLDGNVEWYREILGRIDSLSAELKEGKEQSTEYIKKVWGFVNVYMCKMIVEQDPELMVGYRRLAHKLGEFRDGLHTSRPGAKQFIDRLWRPIRFVSQEVQRKELPGTSQNA